MQLSCTAQQTSGKVYTVHIQPSHAASIRSFKQLRRELRRGSTHAARRGPKPQVCIYKASLLGYSSRILHGWLTCADATGRPRPRCEQGLCLQTPQLHQPRYKTEQMYALLWQHLRQTCFDQCISACLLTACIFDSASFTKCKGVHMPVLH